MYRKLEKKLKISFRNQKLLMESFVHRSYLNEHPNEGLCSNERLEFLGDAILEFLTSEHLYQKFPHFSEGKLTTLRSRLVCTRSLAKIAKKLDLGQHLLLSRGEDESGGRKNPSLLANTFEAVLGAVYLDQDLVAAKKILATYLFPAIKTTKKYRDYKSDFQEISQTKFKFTPVYKTLKEIGPDHARIFTVGVYVGRELWGRGRGKSKQEAEQEAAKKGLERVKSL